MSSSKSSTSNPQTTTQQEGGSAITGVQLQAGGTINYNPQVTPETVDMFQKLIDLSGKSLDSAISTGKLAIDSVQANAERSSQPTESLTRDLMPLAMLATAGVIVYVTFGKK